MIFTRAAGAIVGMVRAEPPADVRRSTDHRRQHVRQHDACVDACRRLLEAAGYEVLVFHATGVGGRTMESLIDEGLVDACLDITTTEWADELCGGVFSAGDDRLSAAGRRGIPHLIVPGCIDMVNFGPLDTVPQKYRDAGRLFYEWNPSVTLMRTNVEENRRMGEIFAEKANAATGPVAVSDSAPRRLDPRRRRPAVLRPRRRRGNVRRASTRTCARTFPSSKSTPTSTTQSSRQRPSR